MSRSLVSTLAALTLAAWGSQATAAEPAISAHFARIPLGFERQTNGNNDSYVARGNGYAISLRQGSAVIGLQPRPEGASSRISMEFVGGRHVNGAASSELPGRVNYILGNDPKKWRFGLPTYERVTYAGVYPGVDVVYYGSQRQLEFDLVLKPGADPSKVRLRFRGAGKLTSTEEGILKIATDAGDLDLLPAAIYQEVDGVRRKVEGRYALVSKDDVEFRLGKYDKAKALVIDPQITYAGMLGGGTGTTQGIGIAVDSSGNAYAVGYTSAADFSTANPIFPYIGNADAFVAKINAAGTALVYSTYIGGSGTDYLESVGVDSAGNAVAVGYTYSPDFPVASPYQATFNGSSSVPNAVVVKLSPSGTLLYSTYFGGSGLVEGYAVAVNGSGNAYVTGTALTGLPTTSGAFLTANQGANDAYVAKFSPTGSLIYSTYLGGSANDYAFSIAVDGSGNAYVTGSTASSSFTNAPSETLSGGLRAALSGASDGFVAELNPAGSALIYLVYLGGSGSDGGEGIAVDSNGNAYVTGYTTSTDFPTTTGAYQTSAPAGANISHGFVSKLSADGSSVVYSTYLAGNRSDIPYGIAVDPAGDAWVVGSTASDRFPVVSPIEPANSGNPTSLFQTTNGANSWVPFDTNFSGAAAGRVGGSHEFQRYHRRYGRRRVPNNQRRIVLVASKQRVVQLPVEEPGE